MILWDVETGKGLAELKHDSGDVSAVAFRRGRSHVSTASVDKTVKLWKWDRERRWCTSERRQNTFWRTALAFISRRPPDLSGTEDKMLHLWEVESGEGSAPLGGQTIRRERGFLA